MYCNIGRAGWLGKGVCCNTHSVLWLGKDFGLLEKLYCNTVSYIVIGGLVWLGVVSQYT